MYKALAAFLLSIAVVVVLGCGGGDSTVASGPDATPGAPGPPGAPGAPDENSEDGSSDGSGEDPNAEMTDDGQSGDEGSDSGENPDDGNGSPDGDGSYTEGDNGEGRGESGDSPDGDEYGEGGRPSVFGKLANSIFGVTSPIMGGPRPSNGDFEGGENPDLSDDGNPAMRAGPKTLQDRATLAFKRGKDEQAFIWLYAQYLAPRGGEQRLVNEMRWATGLRKPALAQRYGLGVTYTAPREFEGDPQPISDRLVPADNPEPNVRRRRGDDNGGGQQNFEPFAQNGDAGEPRPGAEGRLAYYTGDLGTKLVDALKAKFAAGELGLGMADFYREPERPFDPDNPNPDKFAGDGGDFGAGDGGDFGDGDGGRGKADEKVAQIAPGILWLGVGSAKDLEKRANEHNLDVIVMYDVTVRPSPAGNWVNNTTKFRIAGVKSRETIFSSTLLNNVKVIEERKRGKEKDSVDTDIERATVALDAKVKVSDVPAGLKPEHVTSRLAAISADPQLDLLPTLAEAKYYHAKGLLPDKDFEEFTASLLNVERVMPILVQIQGEGMPIQMLEIVYNLAPDLGLQLMDQMNRGGAVRR